MFYLKQVLNKANKISKKIKINPRFGQKTKKNRIVA
jgi:hypothetical protein